MIPLLTNYADAIEFLQLPINNILTYGLVGNSCKSHFFVSPYEKISLKTLGSTVESSLVKNFYKSELKVSLHFINI